MKKTEFGKILAKKRIELGITQAKMAYQLETTSSFLSSIELGKSKLPFHLLEKLIEMYDFSGCEMEHLIRYYVVYAFRLPFFLKNSEINNIHDCITDSIVDGFIRKQREKG